MKKNRRKQSEPTISKGEVIKNVVCIVFVGVVMFVGVGMFLIQLAEKLHAK